MAVVILRRIVTRLIRGQVRRDGPGGPGGFFRQLFVQKAERLFDQFRAMVTARAEEGNGDNDLGKLCVLAGVREFPVRVKCATLAWHTMLSALAREPSLVSTE